MIKIVHHRNKCIGCNACVEAAPKRWGISRRDGKAVLVNGIEKKGIYTIDLQDWELEENLKAKQNCPVKIIEIIKL